MFLKKSISTTMCSMALIALCAGVVNAQEAQKDAPKAPAFADVSGVLFFDYSYLIKEEDKKIDGSEKEKKHSFNLTRAYLTANKKIDDIWSARITLDAGTYSTKDSGGDDDKGSYAFLKNAYGQMALPLGDAAGLKVQFGLVGTPVIGLLDGLNGSRWIYQNYIDKASDITSKSIDISSADTGVRAELSIMKMVNITGMVSNADGYKTNTDKDQDPDQVTKSFYGLVNVTPFGGLNAFGYYHWHDTAKKSDENYFSFIGGGAAWSDKYIKIGAAYTLGSGKAADVKEETSILEFWANVNLQQFANVPVLLIGRYAMGTYEKKAPVKLKNEGSAIWAGVGYQVNNNVQFAAMYKIGALEKKSGGTATSDVENSTFFVKSEIKL